MNHRAVSAVFVHGLFAFSALWMVACENPQPPRQCGPIPQQTVVVGETVTARACFDDPNGDVLAYTATTSDPGVATASSAGSLVTVEGVAPGTVFVTVTATDAGGLQAELRFRVLVPNRAPVAVGVIPPLELAVGDSVVVDVSAHFGDPDGQELSYSAVTSDTSVATVAAAGSVFTVNARAKGMATVTVTATDPGGLEATHTFAVTVPNRAPEAIGSIPGGTVEVGDTLKRTLASYFRDPDGDPLVYSATAANAGMAGVAVSGDTLSVAALAKGVTSVTVTATDTEGLAATQVFDVTVPNRPPVAVGVVPADTVPVGDSATVDPASYFRDPDGDSLAYAAAVSEAGVVGISVSAGAPGITVAAIAKGEVTVTITATDREGLTAAQAFTVTVPNRAPVAVGVAPADTLAVEETTTLDPSVWFSDPDGDPLVYMVTASDTAVVGLVLSGGAVTIMAVAKGEATVTVTATDTEGLAATQTFDVIVPNRTPITGDPVEQRTLAVGDTVAVELSPHFSDPDGDPLTFTLVASDSAVVAVGLSGSTASVIALAKGTAIVTAAATDGEGAPATLAFTIAVSNRAPVAVGSIGARTIAVGASETLDLSPRFNEPDGDALTYAAVVSDSTVVAVSVAATTLTIAAAVKGAATVTVTATDTEGLAAAHAFAVTVPNRAPLAIGTLEALRFNSGGFARVDPAPAFVDPDRDSLAFEAVSSDVHVAKAWVSHGLVLVRGMGGGTATVTVSGRDPEGLSASAAFEVEVRRSRNPDPNRSPVTRGVLHDQSLEVGDVRALQVAQYFSDPDDDDLVFEAGSSDDDIATVTARGSGVEVRGVAEGTAYVTITARDPRGLTASLGFSATVSEATGANRAPTAVGLIEPRSLEPGDSLSLNAALYFLDPDGDSFVLEATSSNVGVATVSVFGSTVLVRTHSEGTVTIAITATDPGELSGTLQFSLTVGVVPPSNFVPCRSGFAGGFPCSGVDLVSRLTREQIGASGIVNDVWGWTDPSTGTEWALVGHYSGTAFVSLADPERPVYVGVLPMTAGATANWWRDIKVYRDHAFVVADNAGAHGMQVFDLGQLRNLPDPPNTFSPTALYTGIGSAHNIVINEATGFAYSVGGGASDACGSGLHIIDIRTPSNPVFAGCFLDPNTGGIVGPGYTHDAMCVVYGGPDTEHRGREVCFGANETRLSIADVTDKSNPVALASASYPDVAYSHQGWLDDAHEYFYMNDELDESTSQSRTRTLIWDVKDLDDPVLIRQFHHRTSASDHNLYVVGDLMYQSNYKAGLRVLNISSRGNPVEIAYFDTEPGASGSGFDSGSWSNYPFFGSGVIPVTSQHGGVFFLRLSN